MSKYRNYKNPVTVTENIKELQEILVQTCIDYAKKNNLTDIYEIQFKVDDIQAGVEFVKMHPKSTMGTADMEGLVGRPKVEMRDRCGKRVIVKIKWEDFK